MTHEVAVVGLGLIGAAAVRHLAAAGVDVVGVGPGEPADRATHLGPFASHHDSGRITRRLDAKREWAVLASRAIDEYGEIERRSGRRFHSPSGLLFVRNDDAGIANQLEVIDALDLPVTQATGAERMADQFPGLTLPPTWTTFHEPGPAGHIDPRQLVEAQLDVAREDGARIVREPVTMLDPDDGTEQATALTVGSDAKIRAERVLIATGAYGNELIPHRLAVAVRPEAVVMGEVTETTADDLAWMPSLIWLLEHDDLDDVYVVPPKLYPDGRWYIKMGGSHRRAATFDTESDSAAMAEWMRGQACDTQLDLMSGVLQNLLPDVPFESWQMQPCLITDTASGLPFVDRVGTNLFVAVGGNGHAAKSSDAIGALAAGLVRDRRWVDDELDADAFAAEFGPYEPGDGSRHGN